MTSLLDRKARRYAHDLELEVRAGNAAHIRELIDSWGLSRELGQATARELQQRLRIPGDDQPVALTFDHWDRAGVRALPDVWAEGLQRR